MSNIFFTSDTHFWHKNIIKYTSRPFKDVLEMNEVLIERWNSKVSSGDIIYHLGDFAFCGASKYEELLKRLNGEKILIKGNHDYRTVKSRFFPDHIFEELRLGDIFLKHQPVEDYSGVYLFHGHLHSKSPRTGPFSFDVGVDGNNFYPWELSEIMDKIKEET